LKPTDHYRIFNSPPANITQSRQLTQCYAASLGKNQTFFIFGFPGLLDLIDKGATVLRNAGNYLPNVIAQRPKATLPTELQNLKSIPPRCVWDLF